MMKIIVTVSWVWILFTTQASAQQDRFWGVHLDFHAGPTDTILYPESDSLFYYNRFKQFIDVAKPDFLQVDSKGHPGYTSWPSSFGSQAGLIGLDPLNLWARVAKKEKIPLWIHYSGVQDEAAISKNKHWAAVDKEGKPYKRATSLLSGYVDSLMIPQMLEAYQKYGITGIWVDGDCWGQEFDYGKAQLDGFYKLYPELKNGAVPEFTSKEWATYQRGQFLAYLHKLRTTLAVKAPGLKTISNWAFSSHMPMPSIEGYNVLSGDLNPTNGVYSAHFEGRFLRSHTKSWDIMLWGHARNFNTGFRTLKSSTQIIQEAAHILALGGGVQVFYNMHRDGGPSKIVQKPLKELSSFVQKWRGLTPYHNPNWRSASDVAVVVPSASVLNKMAANGSLFRAHNGEYDQLHGLSYLLQSAGITYDYLIESDITSDKLNMYKACIFPEADTILPITVSLMKNYKGTVVAGGPQISFFLNALTNLPRLQNRSIEKVNTFRYGEDEIVALSTKVGLLPTEFQSKAKSRLGKTYTADTNSGPFALYYHGKVLTTLFPIGLEYYRQHQSAMSNIVKDFLLTSKCLHIRGKHSNVSLVAYTHQDKNILFLANLLGQHNNASVYQEQFIPAATDVSIFVSGSKPQNLRSIPFVSGIVLKPDNDGWWINVPKVQDLVRLEWTTMSSKRRVY